MTDQDIIASRSLHIEERTKQLNRQPPDWLFRQDCLEEIHFCQIDIESAKYRILLRAQQK